MSVAAKVDAPVIRVGLCGFTVAQARYAELFSVVEVQQTFYQPPVLSVLDRWRQTVPTEFEFTLKAWQLITHSSTSPTYRRLRRVLSDTERADAGAFRPTPIVDEAWRVTLECAARLRATAILFQCPASFRPTEQNLENLRSFFARVKRTGRPANVRLMLEPRGAAWTSDLTGPLCHQLDLIHVVDPLVTATTTLREPFYYRLHGTSGAYHVYSDDELDAIAGVVRPDGETYVMFNNVPRLADAARFMRRLGLRRI